ncbi:MAG: hypothetical protein V3R45_09480, partial [Candidatus Aminicenantaceae bacterium]
MSADALESGKLRQLAEGEEDVPLPVKMIDQLFYRNMDVSFQCSQRYIDRMFTILYTILKIRSST